MRAKKLRTKVVGLVAAVMVVGAPLTAWAIRGASFKNEREIRSGASPVLSVNS
ncbi:hypothetical protein GME01_20030 [Parabacteroides merdae]|nr:hypothetical protein [Parabacteroides merdae]